MALKMKTKNLEKRLQNIAKNIGSEFVIFKLCIDVDGNISILSVENDFDDEEEDENEEIGYPKIIPKIDIKKPLTYLEYMG